MLGILYFDYFESLEWVHCYICILGKYIIGEVDVFREVHAVYKRRSICRGSTS